MAKGKTRSYQTRYGIFQYTVSEKRSNYGLWSMREKEIKITGFAPSGEEAIFPAHIEAVKVTKILLPHEIYPGVKVLSLPNGLRTLYLYNPAFPDLEKVICPPDSFYTDGRMVFSHNRKELYFSLAGNPDEVIHVPEYTQKISNSAFCYCQCKDIVIENPRASIDEGAFRQATLHNESGTFYWKKKLIHVCRGLTQLELPEEEVTIAKDAFEDHVPMVLRSSYLPSLKNVARGNEIGVFDLSSPTALLSQTILTDEYGGLAGVNVPEDHVQYETVDGVLYDKVHRELLYYPRKKRDSSYTVREGTRSIAPVAFNSVSYLKELTIPDSVETLGAYALCSCKRLEHLTLPATLQFLPAVPSYRGYRGIINSCPNLSELALPPNLKIIGRHSIYSNSNLKNLTLPEGVTYLGDFCLPILQDTQLSLPASLKMVGYGAFRGVERVRAYEGTAKGLIKALNPENEPSENVTGWKKKSIIVLDDLGREKTVFYIPGDIDSLAKKHLANAWDADSIDYDAYEIAYQHTHDREEKLLMQILLVLDGNRTGRICELLRTNARSACLLLAGLGLSHVFERFLDLGYLSTGEMTTLLEEFDGEEKKIYRDLLMQKIQTSFQKEQSAPVGDRPQTEGGKPYAQTQS